ALTAVIASLGAFSSFGQNTKPSAAQKSGIEKASRDFLMLQFTYENWANTPDSISLGGLGRGFNAYLCYDWPLGSSNFSFAAGIGVGTANIYLKDQQVILNDTGVLGTQVRFVDELRDYKKYKITTTYLEAPFELRFFTNKENRNKGFKAAAGLRVGTLLGGHTKGSYTVEGAKIVEKVNTKRYLENWRFAATIRLGYGNFSLLGTYNLNGLYKPGMGPEVTPYSIGLCITGL
ncbi:MAG: hypothetical protein EOP49_26655, partial [Sphingobacteriales bacterium]